MLYKLRKGEKKWARALTYFGSPFECKGNPPALPGDSQSLTIAGLKNSLRSVNRSKFNGEETVHGRISEPKITILRQSRRIVTEKRFLLNTPYQTLYPLPLCITPESKELI